MPNIRLFDMAVTVAGPATTQLADDNDDDGREMDFDDVRDFANQDLPCPHSYNGLIGPLADFLSAMPDWVNILENDITQALQGHPVPLPGPVPPGISLTEAIEVN